MPTVNTTLHQLMDELFNSSTPSLLDKDNSKPAPTTIRPSADAVHFFTYHAKRLSISMQDMIALTLNAIATSSTTPAKNEMQLSCDRFKFLFEAHKIPQIHAKSVVEAHANKPFPLGALTNDSILLEHYSLAIKDSLSKIFGVSKGWLDGVDLNAICIEPIYSRDYAYHIYKKLTDHEKLDGIEISSMNMLLVISENDQGLNSSSGKPYEIAMFASPVYVVDQHLTLTTYHLMGLFAPANIESKICLQALLMGASNKNISIQGMMYDQEVVQRLKKGILPASCFKDGLPHIWDHSVLEVEDDIEKEVVSLVKKISS